MKKKFDPQYIAGCRKQIAKAMKDDNTMLSMGDVMTSAAATFGNTSDEEIHRMKDFLIELCMSSLSHLNTADLPRSSSTP